MQDYVTRLNGVRRPYVQSVRPRTLAGPKKLKCLVRAGPTRGYGEPVVFFTSAELADPVREQAAWQFIGIPPAGTSNSAGLHEMFSAAALLQLTERANPSKIEQLAKPTAAAAPHKLAAKQAAPTVPAVLITESDPSEALRFLDPDEVIPPKPLQRFSAEQQRALHAADLPAGEVALSAALSAMPRPQLEQSCMLMRCDLPSLGRYKELPVEALQEHVRRHFNIGLHERPLFVEEMLSYEVLGDNTIMEGLKQFCRDRGIVHSRRNKADLLDAIIELKKLDESPAAQGRLQRLCRKRS